MASSLGGGIDIVVRQINYTLAGFVENLTLAGGSGDLSTTGNDLDNVINGTGGPDVVSGLGGNDTLNAGAGDDILGGGAGNDVLYGETGIDIAWFSGPRSSYSITHSGVGSGLSYVVQGIDGTDTLYGIEGLRFVNDLAVALDPNGVAGQTYRAYEAALGRAPDMGGMGSFMNQLEHGVSLDVLVGSLISSNEFASHFGSNLTNAQFLTLVYQDALHRAPDAEGYAWWLGAMADPNVTRANVVSGFIGSTECKAIFDGAVTDGVDYLPVV